MEFLKVQALCVLILAVLFSATAVSAEIKTQPLYAVPVITWASDPVRPDDTVLLSGGSFDANSVVEVYCLEQPTQVGSPENLSQQDEFIGKIKNWTTIKPIQISENSVKFVIPAEYKMGVFACRIATGDVWSKAVLINSPDVWWMQGDLGKSVSPGGWLRVLGKSLNFGGVSQAFLKADNGKSVALKASAADCYNLTFGLPESVADGNYTVYVHNGMGGDIAWQKAGEIRIMKSKSWPAEIFNVKKIGLDAALAKAKENNGGVIYFPRGQYAMKAQIVLPPQTVIKGEGDKLSTIYWPAMEEPPSSLITGTSFGVEDIAIYVDGYHKNVIEDSPKSDGVKIKKVLVRANAFHGLMDMGDMEKEWRGKKILHGTRESGCVVRMQGSNFQVTDCDILATNKAFEFWNARNGLIARNKIRHGIQGFALECIDEMIIEDNDVSGAHLPSTGNGISSFFSPYARNVYFARNKLQQVYGYDTETFGFDGAGGMYFGQLADAKGTRMVLAKDPKARTYKPTYQDWTGAAFCIMQGKGVGQYRRVAHNEGRNWDIDRPWDIVPDSNSMISIVPFRGRILFIENTLEDAGPVQAYGTSLDCIFAKNRFIRADGMVSWGRNPHGWGWQPSWFCQFLDNHIIAGNRWGSSIAVITTRTTNVEEDDVEAGGSGKMLEFWGPLTSCSIIRRNVIENNAKVEIDGTTSNAVVEHCVMRNSDAGIKVSKDTKNIVLRKNIFENVDNPTSGEGLGHALMLSQ